MTRSFLLALAVLALGVSPAYAQTLISYYDFNAPTPNTLPIKYASPISPTSGTGSIVHNFVANVEAFGGTTINARNGSPLGLAFSPQGGTTAAPGANNGRYLEVQFSTVGLENPVIRFAAQRTATGFNSTAVSYSVDGGTTFVLFTTLAQFPTAFALQTVDLSTVPAVDNTAEVRVRFVLSGASAAAGNNRFDNLTVEGATFVPPTVTVTRAEGFNPTSAQGDGAGYRMLSSPVSGLTVDDLADLNLVQGVPAGMTWEGEPQYPEAGDNLFVNYNPADPEAIGGGFVPAPTTDYTFGRGRGFFWYLYDQTIDPPQETGTSNSVELTGFAYSATGRTLMADTSITMPDYLAPALGGEASRFYLIGNPFALQLPVSGITASPGTIQAGQVQIYDPSISNYVSVSPPAGSLDVWQGAFAEVASSGDQTFTFNYPDANATAPTTTYGKVMAGEVAFRLDGLLASGATVTDVAARVRLNDEASEGWDIHDASKLVPPTGTYALVAPVLTRDGAPYRASISAMPVAPTTVPMVFTTTGAGDFTLTWTAALPAGFTGSLRDLATGAVVDLSANTYSFDAEATAWADRFELVLTGNFVAGEGTPDAALAVSTVRPNPTASSARLHVQAPAGETVTIRVYDALGREVAAAFSGRIAAGGQDVALATDALAPGTYVVRVTAGGDVVSRQLTVLR